MLKTQTLSDQHEEIEESRPISEGGTDLGATGMVSTGSKGRSKVSFVNKSAIEDF